MGAVSQLMEKTHAKELEGPHKPNREWVKRLSEVIKELGLNAKTEKSPPIVTKKLVLSFAHM